MSTRPLLLLDVDGVLNPYPDTPPGYSEYRFFPDDDEPVRLCPDHGAWLIELADAYEIVWATGWGEAANELICPVLGLPPLPVVTLPPMPFDPQAKLPAVAAYAGDRAIAWVDDIVTAEMRAWAGARRAPTLIIEIAPATGLTRRGRTAARLAYRAGVRDTAPDGMRLVVIGCLAAAFAVAVAGGYGLGWQWTGFEDNNTLWDWLQLLVLPVVIAVLPLWYRTHQRLAAEWRIAGIVAAGAAVVVLVGGYALDWDWTGFQGKTLWDWLELLVLPGTLALLPFILASERRNDGRLRAVAIVAAAALVVCALGGYLLGWDWTGFEGNTLWDWIHLLLVPFLVPAALIWFTVERREPEPT